MQPIQMQGMPGPVRNNHHKRELRPAITLTEGMDCVEFAQKRCRLLGKIIGSQVAQIAVPLKLAKGLSELSVNVLRIAKWGAARLAYANSPGLPRPSVTS